MYIKNYRYWENTKNGWVISDVYVEKINLLVGASSSGKTRFLNTLFNLGRIVAGSKNPSNGNWEISFLLDGKKYKYQLEIDEPKTIKKEILTVCIDDIEHIIIERYEEKCTFENIKNPKIKKNISAIDLFQEEDSIKSIYRSFANILRRSFQSSSLNELCGLQSVPTFILQTDPGEVKIDDVFHLVSNVNVRLYYLKKNFPDLFDQIVGNLTEVFPFIKRCKLANFRDFQPNNIHAEFIYLFSIKEDNIDDWIPVTQLSSGIQKVLIIMTDITFLPDGGIYLIDEYENSLGINAINFLPSYVSSIEKEYQLFITSHHPYIINNFPVSSWLIFHRKGNIVKIRSGKECEIKFSKSKQQRFIQLLNDPFYIEGAE